MSRVTRTDFGMGGGGQGPDGGELALDSLQNLAVSQISKQDRVVNSSGSDIVNFHCTEYRGPTQQKLD